MPTGWNPLRHSLQIKSGHVVIRVSWCKDASVERYITGTDCLFLGSLTPPSSIHPIPRNATVLDMRLGSDFLSLLVICYAALVVDADLISRLQGVSGRFTFTYPGLANYSAAVSPCASVSAPCLRGNIR